METVVTELALTPMRGDGLAQYEALEIEQKAREAVL